MISTVPVRNIVVSITRKWISVFLLFPWYWKHLTVGRWWNVLWLQWNSISSVLSSVYCFHRYIRYCHANWLVYEWNVKLHDADLRVVMRLSWWRRQMETHSALLAICAGNSPVTGEFSTQRPVTRIFDVFFDLRQNKWLSKQSWGWWFETLSRPLWRHCNVFAICFVAVV